MTRATPATLIAAAALAAGCSFLAPLPDTSRFYVLASIGSADAGGDAAPLPELSLGIAALTLPSYADRPEIVRRLSPTEVKPSDVDRWAGPLQSNVMRVLAEDLSKLLGTDRISAYPSYEVAQAAYMVQIDVVRFDLDDANRGNLLARWEVRRRDADARVSRSTDSSHAAASASTAAGIEALSLTLYDLSRDIAAAVRDLAKRGNHR